MLTTFCYQQQAVIWTTKFLSCRVYGVPLRIKILIDFDKMNFNRVHFEVETTSIELQKTEFELEKRMYWIPIYEHWTCKRVHQSQNNIPTELLQVMNRSLIFYLYTKSKGNGNVPSLNLSVFNLVSKRRNLATVNHET